MHQIERENARNRNIATDVFIAIFSFLTRRQLANSLQLVSRQINWIIERYFQAHPKLVFRQFYLGSSDRSEDDEKNGMQIPAIWLRNYSIEFSDDATLRWPLSYFLDRGLPEWSKILIPKFTSLISNPAPPYLHFQAINVPVNWIWRHYVLDKTKFHDTFQPLRTSFFNTKLRYHFSAAHFRDANALLENLDSIVLPLFKYCHEFEITGGGDGKYCGKESVITTLLADLLPLHLPMCHSVRLDFDAVMLYPPRVIPPELESQLPFQDIEQLWSYSSLKASETTRPLVNLVDTIVSWLHGSVRNSVVKADETELPQHPRKLFLSVRCLIDKCKTARNARLVQLLIDRLAEVFLDATSVERQRRHYLLELECYKGTGYESQANTYRFESGFLLSNRSTSETLTLVRISDDRRIHNCTSFPIWNMRLERISK